MRFARSRSSGLALTVATMGVLSAGPVNAQGTSILSLLSTDGRALSVGSSESGTLSGSDPRSANDEPLDAWALEGTQGESVTIDLRSSDFDAVLYVVGPGMTNTIRDDDGAGGCDARVELTFLEDGIFTVVASSLGSETGTYTVSVSNEPDPALPYSCGDVDPARILELSTDGRILSRDAVVLSALDGTEPTIQDGRPGVAWALDGTAGERVRIRLTSEDFDTYLYFFGPGMTEVLTDDDGAGDLDSELTLTFPQTGTYHVVASAFGVGSRGAFRLEVLPPVEVDDLPTDGRQVMLGSAVAGFLPNDAPIVMDGRPGQAWAFEATPGLRVAVELRSEDFDPYLYIVGPGLAEPLSDDDGAGNMDSRLVVAFPESGVYSLVVSAFSSGASGGYELEVSPEE